MLGVLTSNEEGGPCERIVCGTAVCGYGFASASQCVGADDRCRGTVGDGTDRQRRRTFGRSDRPRWRSPGGGVGGHLRLVLGGGRVGRGRRARSFGAPV